MFASEAPKAPELCDPFLSAVSNPFGFHGLPDLGQALAHGVLQHPEVAALAALRAQQCPGPTFVRHCQMR